MIIQDLVLSCFILLSGNHLFAFAIPRNISLYPPCVNDDDCLIISDQMEEQYLCFQYMCYPWKQRETDFRKCRRSSECQNLTIEEGGSQDFVDGRCYRHPDRRNVYLGICLDAR